MLSCFGGSSGSGGCLVCCGAMVCASTLMEVVFFGLRERSECGVVHTHVRAISLFCC